MSSTSRFSSTTLLGLAVGLFLLLNGVQAVIDLTSPAARLGQGIGQFFGADQTSLVVSWVAAILQIASGAVLLAGPLGLVTGFARALIFWMILGFWATYALWAGYEGLLAFQSKRQALLPIIRDLSLHVAILAALWQLKPSGKSS